MGRLAHARKRAPRVWRASRCAARGGWPRAATPTRRRLARGAAHGARAGRRGGAQGPGGATARDVTAGEAPREGDALDFAAYRADGDWAAVHDWALRHGLVADGGAPTAASTSLRYRHPVTGTTVRVALAARTGRRARRASWRSAAASLPASPSGPGPEASPRAAAAAAPQT